MPNYTGKRVLGIDPGTSLGWAIVIDGELDKAGHYNYANAASLHGDAGRWTGIRSLLDELSVGLEVVAIEHQVWHTGVRAAQLYGGARATIELWAFEQGLPFVPIAVATAKRALTGRGDASKQSMKAALRRKYGADDPTDAGDMADAVGIALAAAGR